MEGSDLYIQLGAWTRGWTALFVTRTFGCIAMDTFVPSDYVKVTIAASVIAWAKADEALGKYPILDLKSIDSVYGTSTPDW